MIINDKLLIFEDFKTDFNLLKHRKAVVASVVDEGGLVRNNIPTLRPMDVMGWGVQARSVPGRMMMLPPDPFWVVPPTIWFRIWSWFASFWPKPRPTLTIPEFFRSIHNSEEELKVVESRADGYRKALRQARQGGQTALAEQIEGALEASRLEAQLVATGYTRFLSEETVVKFYKKCPRGLRLDWTENFTRHIPQDVLNKKAHLDELCIFDNYVVLHFDPDTKAFAETQAQKDARKDPILFGVIRGCRKLFFVGDWVDEVCDLTLEQIADLLGKGAIEGLEDQGFPGTVK